MMGVTAAVLAIGVGALAVALGRRRPGGVLPALGLGLYLGSCLAVALAVGYGRAAWGPESVERSRYGAVAVPAFLGLYLVWEACGPARLRAAGRATLCMLAFAFLSLNTYRGLEVGAEHRTALDAFRADVRAGRSIPYLASRHAPQTYYVEEKLEETLRTLRDRRVGEYANLPPDPSFREVRLTRPPARLENVVWDGETGRTTSRFGSLLFELPRPIEVAGIRLKYCSKNAGGWDPTPHIGWRTCDEERGKQWKGRQRVFLKSGVAETVTWRVYDTIDRLYIQPDIRPCEFTITDLFLLVAEPRTSDAREGRQPPSATR